MKITILIKDVVSSWSTHNISTLAAALAYYALFSVVPILLISLNVIGVFLNEEVVRTAILNHIKELIGGDTSTQIQLMLNNASKPLIGIKAQLIGWVLLFIGSSALFSEIQNGLNLIWGVRANPTRPWFTLIKNRFLSFIMVLVLSLILLFSFLLSVILTAMANYINHFWNISIMDILLLHTLSFFIVVLLLAMIFKILPDVSIKWRNVWVGALVTTTLFMIGKYLLGVYFNNFQVASMYGAAGSLIILLIWIYYSAQIFFIGAEITKVISLQKHETIKPKRQAIIDTHQPLQVNSNKPPLKGKKAKSGED